MYLCVFICVCLSLFLSVCACMLVCVCVCVCVCVYEQKMSFLRTQQLRELQGIIEEISRDIMWVNEREEEELLFNWGHQNIDTYIPRKQDSYSVRAHTHTHTHKDTTAHYNLGIRVTNQKPNIHRHTHTNLQ